jgi:hypothetical protein
VPAITLTTGGDQPPASFGDAPERLDRKQLTDIGRSAQALLGSIDEFGLISGSRSYVYLGQRSRPRLRSSPHRWRCCFRSPS